MRANGVGRNDPCPCGSGKKYKRCCLVKDIAAEAQSTGTPIGQSLRDALQGQDFDTLEEAQQFASQFQSAHNRQVIDDFHGISAREMHLLLNAPFDSPQLVEFPAVLDAHPDAPVTRIYEMLREAIGEKGLKATAKGNLPRNFCREVAAVYYRESTAPVHRVAEQIEIYRETDFPDLMKLRFILEEDGLLKLRDGRWRLTPRCRQLEKEGGSAAVYPAMLRTFADVVNWGYWDFYAELGIVQAAFAWSLFLLQKDGREKRPETYYAQQFLRAFPAATRDMPPPRFLTLEEEVMQCFITRFLQRFAVFFGLIECEYRAGDIFSAPFDLTARPLLWQVAHFHL